MPTVRWKDDPLEYQRQRYRENPEYFRQWHQKNKVRRAKELEASRQKRKKKDREVYLAKCRAAQRLWRTNNPGKPAAYVAQYRFRNPNASRSAKLKRLFGLTIAQADKLLSGGCRICRRTATCVDHCHATGAIRGGLCATCNGGLGMFKDDPKLLRRAIAYLKKKTCI